MSAPTDIPALDELRAIAKTLGLLAEPLLESAPRDGQARRRERDDLIVELRRAEGRVLDVIPTIYFALTHERERAEQLHAEQEALWTFIESAWDIEPRAYFEQEAPKNGFGYALVQAAHHTWKRDPKVEALQAKLTQAEAALTEAHRQLAECYRLTGADPDGNEDWRLAEHAVAEVRRLRDEHDADAAALTEAREALVKVRMHTSYLPQEQPPFDLLKGLLATIERITDVALAKLAGRPTP